MDYNIQTKTKYLSSNYTNSPLLENKWGALAKLLKGVLVDGFNEQSITKVTYDTSKKQVKIDLALGHGFIKGQVISISGSSDSTFNKEYRIIDSDTESIIIHSDNPINVSDASGIKIKIAPLGYELAFDAIESKGIACFKSKSKLAKILKVIDAVPPNGYNTNWSKYARIVAGFNIDSTGNFVNNEKTPRDSTFPDMENTGNNVQGEAGIHGLLKWDYALNSSYHYSEANGFDTSRFPLGWQIIGDDKTFYLFLEVAGVNYYSILSFGDINGYNESDYIVTGAERAFATNAGYNNKSNASAWRNFFTNNSSNLGLFIGTTAFGAYAPFKKFNILSLFTSTDQKYNPSLATINNVEVLTGVMNILDSDNIIRGTLRGIEQYYSGGSAVDNGTILEAGRRIALRATHQAGDNYWNTIPYMFSLEDW